VRRRAAVLAAASATVALAVPAPAQAHGLVGREDLPIPTWLFVWAAATVLVLSFVALATLWPKPRLEGRRGRAVLRVPAALEALAGAAGVGLFVVTVYAGLAGIQNGTANLAPTIVYVVLWVAMPFLSLLLGDVFAAFNPWRAIGRAAGWLTARTGVQSPEPLAYPARLGRWPAAVGIVAFAWLELAYAQRDDPSTLALLALLYAAAMLVGMTLYGVDAWTRNADAFSVAFRTIARLAPLRWADRRVYVRPPLAGATMLDPRAGTLALLAALIGSTTFDGFSQGPLWSDPSGAGPWLTDRFGDLGLGGVAAREAAATVGLVACVLAVAGLYRLGVRGMATVGREHGQGELARRFAHSLIPIAAAYFVAHYFSLLLFGGQALAYLASDPLGEGSDLLGTADATIDYGLISANGIWYVQVAALVVGHVGGLVLAHDRALVVYRRAREATRSQLWMLAVMVAFTTLGLYVLSATA